MKYEIVELKEKKVAGLRARTNNYAPDMTQVIGGLWQRFYQEAYPQITGMVNGKSLGIYSGYEGDEKSDYDITVACEVDGSGALSEGTSLFMIPAGKYAKFVVTGDLHAEIAKFWQNLWAMDLDRTFVCDFEEYQNKDVENAVIHVYIGIK